MNKDNYRLYKIKLLFRNSKVFKERIKGIRNTFTDMNSFGIYLVKEGKSDSSIKNSEMFLVIKNSDEEMKDIVVSKSMFQRPIVLLNISIGEYNNMSIPCSFMFIYGKNLLLECDKETKYNLVRSCANVISRVEEN